MQPTPENVLIQCWAPVAWLVIVSRSNTYET